MQKSFKQIQTEADILFGLLSKEETLNKKVEELLAPLKEKLDVLKKQTKEVQEDISIKRQELGKLMKTTGINLVENDVYKITPSQTESVNILSEDIAIKWGKEQKSLTNKEYIKTTEKLDTKKFKDYIKQKFAINPKLNIEGIKLETTYTARVEIK